MTSEITMAILANNHFGVLTKIASMFSRRGINIRGLSVGETDNPNHSRLTIHAKGDKVKLQQIYSQMHKLEDVIVVSLLQPDKVCKFGIMLAKLKPENKLGQLEQLAGRVNADLKKIDQECVMLKASGGLNELEQLTDELRRLGLIELAISGPVALDTNPYALSKA